LRCRLHACVLLLHTGCSCEAARGSAALHLLGMAEQHTEEQRIALVCCYHLLHPGARTCFFSFFTGAAPAWRKVQQSCRRTGQHLKGCRQALRTG
jgi:hypothetical protein